MGMTFEAVYENGVLRPLESLALPNMQHVLVTISGTPVTADDVAGYFKLEEWDAANMTTSVPRRSGARARQFQERSRTP